MSTKTPHLTLSQQVFFWAFSLVTIGLVFGFIALVAWPWYFESKELLDQGKSATDALQLRGLFGDSLASLGTLAAGIGLVLTAVAVIWQRRDIDFQLAGIQQSAEAQADMVFGDLRDTLLGATREFAQQCRELRQFVLAGRRSDSKVYQAIDVLHYHFVPLLFAMENEAVGLCAGHYVNNAQLDSLREKLDMCRSDMRMTLGRAMELTRHGFVSDALERYLPAQPELLNSKKRPD
ncbi:MAG: hypothetical protein DPW14_10535 [Planctomycetes bacterium]|nr:hypothetical protein [Planctomycetota bacterium]